MNRPINSLEAIFRAWMPQTAADHNARLRVMEQLAARFPAVAWKVCIDQLSRERRHGSYSHKPKWRNDGHGYGAPLPTWGPIMAFVRDVVEMVLHWKTGYATDMISDLVNCLPSLAPKHRERVWTITEEWAATASDADKAVVREQNRKRLLSRRVRRQANEDDYIVLTASAKRARAALEPADLLQKHEWLFRTHWVEESADELANDAQDYEKREARVAARRTDALREVHLAYGPAGVVELADLGDAHYVVGYLYAQRVLEKDALADAIRFGLGDEQLSKANTRRHFMAGLINGCGDPLDRLALLDRLAEELPDSDFLRVLLAAPFRHETWRRVDTLDEESQCAYWKSVVPEGFMDVDDDAIEAVERLIDAKRPRAAFRSASYNLKKFDPELLFRLMTAIATDSNEPDGHFRLEHYYIEAAFKRINQGTALTLDQKAGLEYVYIDALARPHAHGGKYGIPNLAKYVEWHPELYVNAIVYTYRRNDDGIDPPEFAVPDGQGSQIAMQGHKLLSGMEIVPGSGEHGRIAVDSLRAWVKSVREASMHLGRLEVADLTIGELLSNGSVGSDCVWPCESVRDVLEEVRSEAMMRGVRTGKFNARGAHWRGEGGAQERELADKYRAWADALRYSHPYVASRVLTGLVNTYEHDARREDTEAIVRRRLR